MEIKMYTKTVCPKCLWVKSEIARLGVEAEIINIDENEEAKQLIMDKGFMGVPIVKIEDEWHTNVAAIIETLEEQFG